MTAISRNSDGYAWGDSFLSRIDPRVKIAGFAGLLLVNLLGGSYLVSGVIAVAMALLMIAGRIPYRRQLLMISFPASFAIFTIISQTVFMGGEVFASLGPFDLHLQGLFNGLFISLRIIAGGLIVVVLGVTTPINRLCQALRWFKAPATFIEITQLTYRYLFDIHGEFSRMRDAQQVRLGWSSARAGLASSRLLGGSLFLRVYDRGLRSSEAMRCRGSGPVVNGALPRPGKLDILAGSGAAIFISALVMLAVGVAA
ncbi:MAG: cobalt ECF transporter T component CbiQ [Thermoleophilia bacterium]|nr:cobalt ECF transporter T component CbiQ [Thermoleophilia bacterium]